MKRFIITSLTGLTILTACATIKVPEATGGSRADGIINLSYDIYETIEQPVINWQQAQQTAKARCQGWGYNNAQQFGGGTSQCLQYGDASHECIQSRVTIAYQCTY